MRLSRACRFRRASVLLVSAAAVAAGLTIETSPAGVAHGVDVVAGESLEVAPPRWRIERKFARSLHATYRFTVTAPRLGADEWIAFLPRPIDHPSQEILSIRTTPKSEVVKETSPHRRRVFRWRARPKGDLVTSTSMTVTLDLGAKLFARRLVANEDRSASRARLPGRERRLALSRTGDFDFEAEGVRRFRRRHDLQRMTGEDDVAFAKRVFQTIARGFTYHYVGQQDRRAGAVAEAGKTDCGGLSILFASLLRAQGIPARILAGRWALSDRDGERVGSVEYHQEHVIAEFWAEGAGWVPVDLSSAILHDTSSDKLRFFGNAPGNFVVFHIDSGFVVDSVHFGKREFALLQRVAYFATGKGSFAGSRETERWTVR